MLFKSCLLCRRDSFFWGDVEDDPDVAKLLLTKGRLQKKALTRTTTTKGSHPLKNLFYEKDS